MAIGSSRLVARLVGESSVTQAGTQKWPLLPLVTLFRTLSDHPRTLACPPYLVDLSCTSSSSSSQVAPSGSTLCWEARKLNMSKVHFLQVEKNGGTFTAIPARCYPPILGLGLLLAE